MKDLFHHRVHLQRKIIQSARKEEELNHKTVSNTQEFALIPVAKKKQVSFMRKQHGRKYKSFDASY